MKIEDLIKRYRDFILDQGDEDNELDRDELKSQLHSAVLEALPKVPSMSWEAPSIRETRRAGYQDCLDDVRKKINELFDQEGE